MASIKSKKTRKSITIATTLALCFSALGATGWGIYNITQNLNRSSDFSEGQSIQLNLRLYQTNADGSPVLENGQPKPIFADINQEKQHLESSASSLVTVLQQKSLTNVKVSSGYASITNDMFPGKIEKVGTLYATFENSTTAFKLADTKDAKNEYLNNQRIFESLSSSLRYEFELVKPTYVGNTYKVPTAKQSTGRAQATDPTNGIYYDTTTQRASGTNLNLYTGLDTDSEFKPSTNDKKKDKVTIKSKQELNSWSFVTEKNKYDALAQEEKSMLTQNINDHVYQDQDWYTNAVTPYADEAAAATEQQKHQTSYTWLLWKDKQGLINYLNSLVVIWYYNLYANEPNLILEPDDKGNITHKHLDQIFNTEKWSYASYVDQDTRSKINEIIKNLSATEKGFIAMLGQSKGELNNPSSWQPEIIKEEDLIPVLYNFHNSKTWNADYKEITDESIPSYGISPSVKSGWGWLESANNEDASLSELIGDYLVSKVDHKSFSTHFVNTDNANAADTEPYVTTDIFFDNAKDTELAAFIAHLNNTISFPIITSLQNQFVTNYDDISVQINTLRDKGSKINFGQLDNPETVAFKAERKAFAEEKFSSNNLFTQQKFVKSWYTNSWSGANPLDILMIVMGAILFVIGIFISVRYRIPGVVAFIISAFVFVLSMVLFNVFGFGSSLYSFIAVAFGSFLSLLSPIFLCRNTIKEIKESSTISASIVKSVKKYWKTSLDFHMISIVCSLSFLFFGIGGNINFGSMLVISVFLSFLLSGILFFVLMLFYTQYAQSNTYKWFFARGYYAKIVNVNAQNNENKISNTWWFKAWNYFVTKLNLNNKTMLISIGGFLIIAIIGVFILSFLGSTTSLDFKNSNIILIRNASQLNISINDIISKLNISAMQSYIYNNEIYIYTSQIFEINQIIDAVRALTSSSSKLIANSVLFTTLTTDVSVQLVLNTLKCIGIAIGFSAVWAMLSLNIVAIIPLAIIQIVPIFMLTGLFGVTQFPLQLEITLIMSLIFMINSVIASASLSALKSSWNRTQQIEKNELKALFANILSKTNMNYLIFIGEFAILSVFSMIFASVSLILIFVSLLIMLAWISFYTNRMLIFVWYYCVLLRNIFSKEILHDKNKKNIKINYDFIDEQIIGGINN